MLPQIWRHVLKFHYGHVNIKEVNSFNNQKKKFETRIRLEMKTGEETNLKFEGHVGRIRWQRKITI